MLTVVLVASCAWIYRANMPYKCCVPSCKSNYDRTTDYISVYKFPTDSKRLDLWMRKIPRENLTITKNSRVCLKHFEERFIVRNFVYRGKDGQMRTDPRDIPVLTEDAYPSIFPDLPQYLTEKLPAQRKDPDKRRAEVDERSGAILSDFLQSDIIVDYVDFSGNIQSRITDFVAGNRWSVFSGSNATFMYVFDHESDIPGLSVCIKINSDMSVELFVGDQRLSKQKLSWILGDSSLLGRWSQLESMLSHYKDYSSRETRNLTDIEQNIEQAAVTERLPKSANPPRLAPHNSNIATLDQICAGTTGCRLHPAG